MFSDDRSFWPEAIEVDLADLDDATIWAATRNDPTVHYRRATEIARGERTSAF